MLQKAEKFILLVEIPGKSYLPGIDESMSNNDISRIILFQDIHPADFFAWAGLDFQNV